MSGTEQVTMGFQPQTLAEPIRAGEFQNLSAAQIERITRIWDKIECHAPMTQQEMLAMFDSRPESIDRDTNALEYVIYILGPSPYESSDHGTDPALVANYLLNKLRAKLDPTFRGEEEPPPTAGLDEYFEMVFDTGSGS